MAMLQDEHPLLLFGGKILRANQDAMQVGKISLGVQQ